MSLLARFARDRSGNIAVTFSLSVLPLLAVPGVAVDYSRASMARAQLQAQTDAAALNAALARGVTDQQRTSLAQSSVRAAPNYESLSVSAALDGKAVTVTASASVRTAILEVLGFRHIDIGARSTAVRSNDGPPVCVLALNPTASGAVTFAGSSSFVAANCAVYSNSSAGNGLVIQGSATVKAAGFCSVGGASNAASASPAPQTYCDRLDDPLRDLPAADTSGCTYTAVSVGPSKTATLDPGVYCQGLDLKGTVTLNPGLYVIKNGPLTISSQANVTGAGVSFYLAGQGAGFTINASGTVDLSAMTTGAYAGVLLMQDRASNVGATNTLNGTSDTKLKGVVYTATQSLTINGSGTFGQQTPFLSIIADQVKFAGASATQADLTAIALAAPLPKFSTGARLTQ
jgi:Flp pilus assembly protein TadG